MGHKCKQEKLSLHEIVTLHINLYLLLKCYVQYLFTITISELTRKRCIFCFNILFLKKIEINKFSSKKRIIFKVISLPIKI